MKQNVLGSEACLYFFFLCPLSPAQMLQLKKKVLFQLELLDKMDWYFCGIPAEACIKKYMVSLQVIPLWDPLNQNLLMAMFWKHCCSSSFFWSAFTFTGCPHKKPSLWGQKIKCQTDNLGQKNSFICRYHFSCEI